MLIWIYSDIRSYHFLYEYFRIFVCIIFYTNIFGYSFVSQINIQRKMTSPLLYQLCFNFLLYHTSKSNIIYSYNFLIWIYSDICSHNFLDINIFKYLLVSKIYIRHTLFHTQVCSFTHFLHIICILCVISCSVYFLTIFTHMPFVNYVERYFHFCVCLYFVNVYCIFSNLNFNLNLFVFAWMVCPNFFTWKETSASLLIPFVCVFVFWFDLYLYFI